MRVLMFRREFCAAILCGAKSMTIRKRARCVAGDPLSLRLWAGLPYRTKQIELLQVECRAVVPVAILGNFGLRVWVDGQELSSRRIGQLAKDDGFPSARGFYDFFARTHGFPFAGEIIAWL